MAADQTRIGIAQHEFTGEYCVVINAVSGGESLMKTYIDTDTARAMARSREETADEIDRRNATATHTAAQALETMRRG